MQLEEKKNPNSTKKWRVFGYNNIKALKVD
jgi:hypothetical protein